MDKKQKATDYLTPATNEYKTTKKATIFMASFKYYFEKDLPIPADLKVGWEQMIIITMS